MGVGLAACCGPCIVESRQARCTGRVLPGIAVGVGMLPANAGENLRVHQGMPGGGPVQQSGANYIPTLRTGKLTETLTYLVLATLGAPCTGPLGQRQASLVACGGCSVAPPGRPVRCVPTRVLVPEAPWSRWLSQWGAMVMGGVVR